MPGPRCRESSGRALTRPQGFAAGGSGLDLSGYPGLASEQTSPHMSLHFRADRPWPHVALVVLASACIFSLAASTARAAEQWNDGVPATSTQVKCVINLQETGAIAKAGYLADPSKPPMAGQVFYGRADFGATTDTACGSGDQVAELDVVLPPGVSLASGLRASDHLPLRGRRRDGRRAIRRVPRKRSSAPTGRRSRPTMRGTPGRCLPGESSTSAFR